MHDSPCLPMTEPKKTESAARGNWQIQPAGDRCLIIEFAPDISIETNRLVHAVATYLQMNPITRRNGYRPGLQHRCIALLPGIFSILAHYRHTGN